MVWEVKGVAERNLSAAFSSLFWFLLPTTVFWLTLATLVSGNLTRRKVLYI